jgi:hypothetical protein
MCIYRRLELRNLVIVLLALVAACGRRGDSSDSFDAPAAYSIPDDVQELDWTYRQLAPTVQDQWGFIQTDACDSTLYTGLLGAAGVPIADISAAEDPSNPGKWVRRPQFREGTPKPCFPGGSASSISRDMLLGLMWYGWANKDLALLQRIYDYAEVHGGTMGEGDATRTGIRTLRGTLTAEIAALGGASHPFQDLITDPELFANDGYQAHLQVLHLLLRGEIYGRLSDHSKDIIRSLADKNPDVPVMQAAAARWVDKSYNWKFIVSIRNQRLFPPTRLPTTSDRCLPWISNQTNPLDLIPCVIPTGVRTHSGGDAIFAIWIYTGLPVR